VKRKILRLPEAVINQIAAGEVVENPASIVKELIENSLDAGAKNITVEIVSGGQQLIRVEDDGSGMGPEDALLCLERHATSKISSVDDLQTLCTMGFRGEALAAISSVSQFELKTSDGTATRVVSEGGSIQSVGPCARNQGTTIEVRSLFYNVPARKKFQKSSSANTAQVTHIVEVLSLAHPEVGFSLISNGKKTIELLASSEKQRIEEVLGSFEHEIGRKNGSVSGFIASPVRAMPNRTGQYLFMNKRPIFSPLLSKAVKSGFGTRIAEHAYPPFVLFLEVSPDLVDVNVHPQKKEVRFKEESVLFRIVQKAVENAFSSTLAFSEPLFFTPPPAYSFAESFPSSGFKMAAPEPVPELGLVFQDVPLAVIGKTLVLQRENLIVVDLPAAFARILFESIKYEKPQSQALMWPLEIALERGEEIALENLAELGIECRVLNRTLVIDALPSILEETHFPYFFAHWKEGKKMETIATRFCRSIKKSYLLDEAFLLWRKLQKCRDCLYDPLGNPIWAELKETDLCQIITGKKNS